MKVAIVGIHSQFCLQLQKLLETQSHRVSLVPEVEKAGQRLREEPAHLIVIDGVPSKDSAIELIRTLRGHGPTRRVAILNVNPSGSAADVVELLDAGADDFLAKPFNGQIFLARVRTLLRRQIWSGTIQEDPVTRFTAGPVVIHLIERSVLVSGTEVPMTRLEFDLLTYLVRHKGETIKRANILEAVWKYPEDVETRTLDKHVENLRRKLGAPGKNIKTVHGVGYRYLDAPLKAAKVGE